MRRIIASMPEEQPQTAASDARKLAAIMFTDMVGFSRQMGSDEARMLHVVAALRKAGLK